MVSTVALPYAVDVAPTATERRQTAVVLSSAGDGSGGSLLVVDLRNPQRPRTVGSVECAMGTLLEATRTAPEVFAVFVVPDGRPCLGLDDYGFALVDVSRPKKPRVLSAAVHESGTPTALPRTIGRPPFHSSAAHPSAAYLYTTRLAGESGEILVWALEGRTPELKTRIPLPAPPHGISVDPSGTTLAVAGGPGFATYDLGDPAAPELASVQHCPGCSQTTLAGFAGDALVVYDASLNPVDCPSGALYFYAVDLPVPRLSGVYNPSRVDEDPAAAPLPRRCTAADLEISGDGTRAVLVWADNSVRLLDIEDTVGAGASEAGSGPVREAGWFRFGSGDVRSARFLSNHQILVTDRNLGLHVLEAR